MTKIIHFEPTSKCNAACPMCARNVNGEGCIVSLGDLSLEHFQIQVTKNIKTLEKVFFCGNVGDPCADVNLLEKISWIKNIQPKIVVGINTNGSIRNTKWWKECANLLTGQYDYVVFSIDGLQDTNHIYRVGVQFKKVMENVQAYINEGASAHWDMLVFDHNKHQVEQCKRLARNMGFTWFRSKETDRWDTYTSDIGILPADEFHPTTPSSDITCEVKRDSSIFIDYTGNYWPCCHMAEAYLNKVGIELHSDIRNFNNEELFNEYKIRLNTGKPFNICKRACGNTTNKQSQWKTENQLK